MESSCFVSGVDCEGLEGSVGCWGLGESSACGAPWFGLLLGGPSVTELLLRRSPLLLRRNERYDRVEALRLHAERTATVTEVG